MNKCLLIFTASHVWRAFLSIIKCDCITVNITLQSCELDIFYLEMTDNSKTASHLGQSCDMLTLYLKACSAVYRVTQKAVLQASGLIHNLAHSLSHVSHSLSSLGRLLPLIQFRSVCMVSSRVQFLFYLFIYYYNFFFTKWLQFRLGLYGMAPCRSLTIEKWVALIWEVYKGEKSDEDSRTARGTTVRTVNYSSEQEETCWWIREKLPKTRKQARNTAVLEVENAMRERKLNVRAFLSSWTSCSVFSAILCIIINRGAVINSDN